MKLALATVLIVVLASCAGPPTSQEVQKIVPLIKAEKFDDAAAINPDLFAPAIVEALREMKGEGADPNRIVRVADFFFDNYPFSIRDVAIDEAVIEAVAEVHLEVKARLTAALPSCAVMESARTLGDAADVLESWTKEHADGERCARHVVQLLQRALRAGPTWNREALTYSIPGMDSRGADDQVRELVRASYVPLAGSRQLPLIALLTTHLLERCRNSRWETWNGLRETIHLEERSPRIYYSRFSWLGAHRHPPLFDGWRKAGLAWKESRFDPRMRDLGAAMSEFGACADPVEGGDERGIPETADRLIRSGKGTPFPDAARYSWIARDFDWNHPKGTDELLRRLLPGFERPFYACHALLDRGAFRIWLDDPPGAPVIGRKLLQEALDLDPRGPVAHRALSLLADADGDEGRESDMIAKLDSILRFAGEPRSDYELQEDLLEYQAMARQKLAKHFQKRGEWRRALEHWTRFETYGWCGNGHWAQETEQELGMGECLERLGRVDEALSCYWRAVEIQDSGEEAAESLVRIYRERKALGQFRRLSLELLERETKEGGNLDYQPGLKRLAKEVGAPVK